MKMREGILFQGVESGSELDIYIYMYVISYK